MLHNFLIYKNTTLKHKLKQNTQICTPCEMHIYFQKEYSQHIKDDIKLQ